MTASDALRLRSWRAVIPGSVLAVTLAFTAKGAALELAAWPATSAIPVSPVVFAVLLGVMWRNLVGVGRRVERGLQWVMHALLRIGIALVGLRLTFNGLWNVGAYGLPIIAGCAAVALLVAILLGRAAGISSRLQLLLAVGTAVCGCTAVVAVAPLLRARGVETGLALGSVVVLGCLGMLAYPWLASTLFAPSHLAAGMFLGTSIHDTSQVVGASLIYAQQFGSPDTVAVASATKLLRNLSMLLIVPLAAWWGRRVLDEPAASGVVLHRSQAFPGFVLWFALLVLVRTLGDSTFASQSALWWPQTLHIAQAISEFFLVCGMTAVGLSVSVSQLRGAGWRTVCVALGVAVAVAATSATLIHATGNHAG